MRTLWGFGLQGPGQPDEAWPHGEPHSFPNKKLINRPLSIVRAGPPHAPICPSELSEAQSPPVYTSVHTPPISRPLSPPVAITPPLNPLVASPTNGLRHLPLPTSQGPSATVALTDCQKQLSLLTPVSAAVAASPSSIRGGLSDGSAAACGPLSLCVLVGDTRVLRACVGGLSRFDWLVRVKCPSTNRGLHSGWYILLILSLMVIVATTVCLDTHCSSTGRSVRQACFY